MGCVHFVEAGTHSIISKKPSKCNSNITELDVGWVLHVADGAPAVEPEHALDGSNWIPAFTKILDTFRLTLGLVPGHSSMEKEEHARKSEEKNMAELQLARFTQQAMLKMLAFVDFIVAPNLAC